MRQVFEHIARRSAEYAENPMFAYLRDGRIEPQRRLEFVPWISHFVMTFADLYNHFLREEPASDRFQELVNTHLSEESTHWKWFLVDLETMGLNPTLRFADALRLLWGPETLRTRVLAYEVCRMSAQRTSLEKLAMVHAIEATGRVALEALVPVGNEFGQVAGSKLVYFGQHHLDTERTHTVEEEGTHAFLEKTPLDEDQVASLIKIVDEIFDHFGRFADEAFERATQERDFRSVATDGRRRATA